MKRSRSREPEPREQRGYREYMLRGKILPNKCVYIALNEHDYDIKEHIAESPSNWVFFFPISSEILKAACVTRDQVIDYAKIFYKCTSESLASVVREKPFYQLQINEYPIYVSEENFEAMKQNQNTPFYLVRQAYYSLPYTISHETLEGEDPERYVSADHCQKGTEKDISEVYPVNSKEVITKLDIPVPKNCWHITQMGKDCLFKTDSKLTIGDKCYEFCKLHYEPIFKKLITAMLVGPWRDAIDSEQTHVVEHMWFNSSISLDQPNIQLKIDKRPTRNWWDIEANYQLRYGIDVARDLVIESSHASEVVKSVFNYVRENNVEWEVGILFQTEGSWQSPKNRSVFLVIEDVKVPFTITPFGKGRQKVLTLNIRKRL